MAFDIEKISRATSSVTSEELHEILLDAAIEMTFPSSDAIAVASNVTSTRIAPDMVPTRIEHQNSEILKIQ
jgi:hypothetical protein